METFQSRRTLGRGGLAAAAAGLALVLASAGAFAKPPTCSITSPQNDPANVTAGGSALFQGLVTSGVEPYNVDWTFEGVRQQMPVT